MWPCCRFFLNLQQEDEAQQFTVRVCREKICAEEEKKKLLHQLPVPPKQINAVHCRERHC